MLFSILVAIQLDHQTLHIDIHQICGWNARLYNQLTAILMSRELGKTLIFVLGQRLPDFLDSNSVYTKCKIKIFLKLIFQKFRQNHGLNNVWPCPITHIVNYVAFMFKQGYSPSTVKAYLSGISYYIKSNGLEDVTQSFIIQKMMMRQKA
jgi:hypothetical protein